MLQVARNVHRDQIAQLWLMLRVMYAFDAVSTQNSLETSSRLPVHSITISNDVDKSLRDTSSLNTLASRDETHTESSSTLTTLHSHPVSTSATRIVVDRSPTHPPLSLTPTPFIPSPSHQLLSLSPSSSPPDDELQLLPPLGLGPAPSPTLLSPQPSTLSTHPQPTLTPVNIDNKQTETVSSTTTPTVTHHPHHQKQKPSHRHHHSYHSHDYSPLTTEMWQDVVLNALHYYAQQGDVQTCATVLLVLNQRHENECFSQGQKQTLKSESHRYLLQPAKKIALQWFMAYIDLLCRLELWTCANEVITCCYLDAVHHANQKSTTIATACASCSKPIQSGWLCDRPTCRGSPIRPSTQPPPATPQPSPSLSQSHITLTQVSSRPVMNLCSVCHQHVRGLWAWCQGCGHGGHLHHLKDWFATERACPAGCSHYCVYSF